VAHLSFLSFFSSALVILIVRSTGGVQAHEFGEQIEQTLFVIRKRKTAHLQVSCVATDSNHIRLMKIALICNEYPPRPHGGIGTFVQALARALSVRGHQVQVVGIGKGAEEAADGPIQITILRASRLRFVGNVLSRLKLRAWLSDRVQRREIELIEVPDYLGLLPFGVRDCPTIVRLHMTTSAIFSQAGLKRPRGIFFCERMTLKTNRCWIGVSQYILDFTKEFFRLSPVKGIRIYNPVPTAPKVLPTIANLPGKYILYAGQVSKNKGALVLAEAARTLLAERSELHLVYVGGEITQPNVSSIQAQTIQIMGTKLAARVHFVGRVDREKVLSYMKQAAVFAFPSKLEALGLVVLEAMNCGAPVVCTSVPPGPEMVEDEMTGLLADPDSPGDFARQMARILDDPSLAEKLTTNAKQLLRVRFSLERCVQETESFYRDCLAEEPGPAR
jgi:glycosyltransferase involved in cell wall biosynthesis